MCYKEFEVENLSSISCWFKFMVYFFRVSSVEIDYSVLHKHGKRIKMLTIGVIAFFFDILGCLWTAYYLNKNILSQVFFTNSNKLSDQRKFAFACSILAEYFSITFLIIGVHVILLSTSFQVRWVQLWDKLQTAVQYTQSANKLKRMAVTCTLYILIEIAYIVYSITTWWRPTVTITENVLDILIYPVQLHAANGLLLYCTSCFITRSVYQVLFKELATVCHQQCERTTKEELLQKLIRMRKLNILLSETCRLIQECFSSILLFWIVYVFAQIVPSSYYFLKGITRNEEQLFSLRLSVWGAVVMMKLIIAIFAIAAVTSSMIEQVRNNYSVVRRCIVFLGADFEDLARCFSFEFYHSIPKITAMGLCDVNLSLIPALLGATAAYLIILCQFKE